MVRTLNEFEEFDEQTQLFDVGILDSLLLLYLVTEIENHYGIQIREEDIVLNHFKDIATIKKFLEETYQIRE